VATYGLPYEATSDWVASAQEGIDLLAKHLASQSTECPAQKFVLLGYSQGSWVIGDALAGGGGGVAPAVSSTLGDKVAAIVLYGDPRFTSGESYNVGTAKAGVSGIIPREVGGLKAYATRIRSYCYSDDTICQNGTSGDGHIQYFTHETADATKFVLSKLGAATPSPATPSPVPTTTAPTPTATPTPTVTATVTATPTATTTIPAPPAPQPGRWHRFCHWLNPFD
jgi:hypothetical protein